jgi:hypothetical protein
LRSEEFTRNADLIVEPPVARFPLLNFAMCPEIIDCGHESGAEALDEWLDGAGRPALEAAGVRTVAGG